MAKRIERDEYAGSQQKALRDYPQLVTAAKMSLMAIDSLMGEIGGKAATDWGLVNDTLIRLERLIGGAK